MNLLQCIHQTCDIQMEGTVRRLTLKTCQLDQAGEVSYQALNAITNAMLNVKGKQNSWHPGLELQCTMILGDVKSCKNKGVRSVE